MMLPASNQLNARESSISNQVQTLGAHEHALTLGDVLRLLRPLLDYATQRGLPMTALGNLREPEDVARVLGTLVKAGVVHEYVDGLEPVFHIEPGQHAVAAYYRNSAIHWFVNRTIVELGAMIASQQGVGESLERGWASALAMRDLLKFEFFFSEKQTFRDEIRAEANLLDPAYSTHLAQRESAESALVRAPFLVAHRVLPAFLEAYFIVADRLAALPVDAPVNKPVLLKQCIDVGRQYILQKRLHNPECVSQELFGNALSLLANRGLLDPGTPDLASRRANFVVELEQAVEAVATIEEIDKRRLSCLKIAGAPAAAATPNRRLSAH